MNFIKLNILLNFQEILLRFYFVWCPDLVNFSYKSYSVRYGPNSQPVALRNKGGCVFTVHNTKQFIFFIVRLHW